MICSGAIGATNLEHLRACAIWVPVKIIPKRGKPGKTDKVPVNAGGYNIDAQNPANCMSWWEADLIRQSLPGDTGVGLVMHPGSGLFCVDLDDCIVPPSVAQPSGGLTDLALGMIEALPGVLMERSHSGRGLHLWGYATLGDHRTRSDRVPGIEVYTSGRFILVTDDMLAGWMDGHSNALGAMCSALFGEQAPTVPFDWADTGSGDHLSDDEIIRRVRAHRMRDSEKNGRMLWDGEADEIAAHYPSSTGEMYDGSGADLALATLLMHYTGNNAERSSRMLAESGLARDKHGREDYMRWTIERAYRPELRAPIRPETLPWTPIQCAAAPQPVENVNGAVQSAPAQTAEQPLWTVPIWPPGHFLDDADLQRHFAGVVHVIKREHMYLPDGRTLNERQFNALFGGSGWNFKISTDNKVTRKPWDAFMNNEVFTPTKVDSVYFDPSAAPGTICDDRVNTWLPPRVRVEAGDPTLYLDLLRRQIPDERDRRILLSWMAACVQHRDVKFRWSPYIQGCKGNGKTTHLDILEYCIGVNYTCRPAADKMGKQFNAIYDRKLLVCVDDINMSGQGALWDKLKPMITEGVMEIEPKGVNSDNVRGMRNKYMFTSNEQSGLPVTADERRLAPFFTAQQDRDDLEAQGMGNGYFTALHDWLGIGSHQNGLAIVAHYLMNYPIDPEFNPAGACNRAPWTTSTQTAIDKSRSGVERHVQDAIEITGELGADGTVNHHQVQMVYRKHNARMPDIGEISELLRQLGYRRDMSAPGPLWRKRASVPAVPSAPINS